MRRFFRSLMTRSPELSNDYPKIKIGVCAMDKKATSKPMKAILSRLLAYGEFEVILFGDECILHQHIEQWPQCDCLLSWHSEGFPLKKAQAYAALRKPFLVNDLFMQDLLLDRRFVYRTLVSCNIPVPMHIIVDREGLEPGQDPPGFVEDDDFVELDGVRIFKPFVEKPAAADDHNIYIYYPTSMGGGIKRLFRKVDNKSSLYDPQHPGTVRRQGSYIYEEFLPTGGTDVKVYTVGQRYAHAEARKSPVVDGKVLRTPDGKEMRFPVLLSPQEKEVACMVVTAFGQRVCGFDLLRSERGKSYVCDVNGWSFVKNSKRFYDDAAGLLRNIILGAVAPERLAAVPNPEIRLPTPHQRSASVTMGLGLADDDAALLAENDEEDEWIPGVDEREVAWTDNRSQQEELRCVLAVIRHGDRTPKQKLKLRVTAEALLAMFYKYKDAKGKQAKLKSPTQLQELLDITRNLLEGLEKQDSLEGAGLSDEDRDAQVEMREKLRIVRTVLEQAAFSGINRKVQIKPHKWALPSAGASMQAAATAAAAALAAEEKLGKQDGPADKPAAATAPATAATADGRDGFLTSGGASTPNALSTHAFASGSQQAVLEEAVMILKWGGVLTHAGRQQAEDLGKVFRMVMYPRYGSAGGGLLRLHSTYRHDLKIYSSDEGRVQASAAAFAKGLLDLEGNSLTPILVSLVKKDASMLDAFGKGASDDIRDAKNVVYQAMTWDALKAASGSTPLQGTPPPTPPHMSPRIVSRAGSFVDARSLQTRASIGMPQQPQPQQHQQQQQVRVLPALQDTAVQLALPRLRSLQDQGADSAASGVDSPHNAFYNSRESFDLAAANNSSAGGNKRESEQGGGGGWLSATSSLHMAQGHTGLTAPPSPMVPGRYSVSGAGLMCGSYSNSGGGVATGGGDAAAASIRAMPEQPLVLLHKMVELMKVLVAQLRELCLQENVSKGAAPRYTSLSQEPSEWRLDPERPCSGERMLLMFDRWQKLLKSFYSGKKDKYDISKVPDIYDSAKYDTIHNRHLGLDLQELYACAKQLADVVIPNEYGVDPAGKLRIGSKICSELLGKLLVDLAAMREESVATAKLEAVGAGSADLNDALPTSKLAIAAGGALTCPTARDTPARAQAPAQQQEEERGSGTAACGMGGGGEDGDGSGVGDKQEVATGDKQQDARHPEEEEEDAALENETMHRLAPQYASMINSPLRHVRTRLYFTSESHIHSLVNVLHYCHLQQALLHQQLPAQPQQQQGAEGVASAGAAAAGPRPLLRPEALELLDNTTELDYLTHVVFRMYENKAVPVNAPERFRVEILFSPGAAFSPFELCPPKNDHTLPLVPRVQLHNGSAGVPLCELERLLLPMAKTGKYSASTYGLQSLGNTGKMPPTLSRMQSRYSSAPNMKDSSKSLGSDTAYGSDTL